jgi:tetratricopeptide (TPR) repeat protein
MGHAFSPAYEHHWILPFDENRLITRTYDPLYFPARILGREQGAIYLYEPNSKKLKQPLFGNIFSLSFDTPKGVDWFSGDAKLMTCWDQQSKNLLFYSTDGTLCCQATLPGRPVPSNCGSQHVWIHSSSHLQLWELEMQVAQDLLPSTSHSPFIALQTSIRRKAESMDVLPFFEELKSALQSYLLDCNAFLQHFGAGECEDKAFDQYQQSRKAMHLKINSTQLDLAVQPLTLLEFEHHLLDKALQQTGKGKVGESLQTIFDRCSNEICALVDAILSQMEKTFQREQHERNQGSALSEMSCGRLWLQLAEMDTLAAKILDWLFTKCLNNDSTPSRDESSGEEDRHASSNLETPFFLHPQVRFASPLFCLSQRLSELHDISASRFSHYVAMAQTLSVNSSLETAVAWLINCAYEYPLAAKILEQLLIEQPQNGDWNYMLAVCFHYSGSDLNKALEYYDRALTSDVFPFWILANRASLCLHLGKTDEAIKNARQVVSIGSKHEYAQALMQQMRELLSSHDKGMK